MPMYLGEVYGRLHISKRLFRGSRPARGLQVVRVCCWWAGHLSDLIPPELKLAMLALHGHIRVETKVLEVRVQGGPVLAIAPADLQQVVLHFIVHVDLQRITVTVKSSARLAVSCTPRTAMLPNN